MTETKPNINQALFQKVFDQITFHPETHDQDNWEIPSSNPDYPTEYFNECDTTRCVAGWALHLHNPSQHIRRTAESVCENGLYSGDAHLLCGAAQLLLGLTNNEATHLFAGDLSNKEAVEMVERYALKGNEARDA